MAESKTEQDREWRKHWFKGLARERQENRLPTLTRHRWWLLGALVVGAAFVQPPEAIGLWLIALFVAYYQGDEIGRMDERRQIEENPFGLSGQEYRASMEIEEILDVLRTSDPQKFPLKEFSRLHSLEIRHSFHNGKLNDPPWEVTREGERVHVRINTNAWAFDVTQDKVFYVLNVVTDVLTEMLAEEGKMHPATVSEIKQGILRKMSSAKHGAIVHPGLFSRKVDSDGKEQT